VSYTQHLAEPVLDVNQPKPKATRNTQQSVGPILLCGTKADLACVFRILRGPVPLTKTLPLLVEELSDHCCGIDRSVAHVPRCAV
jgi:hypothetical protein